MVWATEGDSPSEVLFNVAYLMFAWPAYVYLIVSQWKRGEL